MHYIIIADPQTLTAAGATTTEAERSVVELGGLEGRETRRRSRFRSHASN